MTPAAKKFVHYLDTTLIPDLRDSGRAATADDLDDLSDMIKHHETRPGRKKIQKRFIDYLTTTLIPDLKASGHKYTAEDFQKGVRFWRSAKKVKR